MVFFFEPEHGPDIKVENKVYQNRNIKKEAFFWE